SVFHRQEVEGHRRITIQHEVPGLELVIDVGRHVQLVMHEPMHDLLWEDDVFPNEVREDVPARVERDQPHWQESVAFPSTSPVGPTGAKAIIQDRQRRYHRRTDSNYGIL